MAKGNVAGLYTAQIFITYNGYSYGQIADPANVAAGTTSHAYLVRDPIEASIPEVTRAEATFRGGGRTFGKMQLGVEEIGSFPVQFAAYDPTVFALCGGSSVDTTSVSGWTISGPNNSNPELPQVGMILTSRYQSRVDGTNKYLNYLFPIGQLVLQSPALTQEGGVNPSPVRGTFTPTFSTKFPNGVGFGTNQDFYNNETDHVLIETNFPLAMTTFVADDSDTTFDVGYLPQYSTVTSGNTNNWFAENGATSAPTSISTSDGAVVIPSATANDIWVVLYQAQKNFTATS